MMGEYHSREDNLTADWATDPCCSSIVCPYSTEIIEAQVHGYQ